MAGAGQRVRLIVLTGHRVGEEAVVEDGLVIGRLAECGLQIDETGVSRRHAEVSVDGDTVWLRDLGSSNGTKLHGSRVQEARLADGDVVELGPVKVRVRIEGAAARPPAPPAPPVPDVEELSIEPSPPPVAARAAASRPAASRPVAPAPRPAPAADARGRGPLQYHRIEGRGGLLRDDLGQSPLWVRALVWLVVTALGVAAFWFAYTAAAG